MFKGLLLSLIVLSLNVANASTLESLSVVESDAGASANLRMTEMSANITPKVEFINETIQVDIPGAKVKDGKIQKRVDGDVVRSLFAYQLNDNTARFRMILQKGQKANQFKETFAFEPNENGYAITISQGLAKTSAVKEAAPTAVAPTEEIDEVAIEEELKSLVASSAKTPPAETKTETPKAKNALSAESEIPAFSGETPTKKAKPQAVSTGRVIGGLVIIALALLGFWVAASRYLNKKNANSPHRSIRVVTQHHLGPKKSLAIISVAGEMMLIGVTDHNISMIKSLSLLDEDIPQNVPKEFEQSLDLANTQNHFEDNVEDFTVKGVKDIVADRIKGMRNLW